MIATHYMAGLAAVASAGLALMTGANAVLEVVTPPKIEGTAIYSEPVSAGDDILIPWVIEKRTPCPGKVARLWEGQGGFYLVEPTRPASLPQTDGPVVYQVQTHIPDLAPSGVLRMYIVGEYDCEGQADRFKLGPVELIVQ